MSEAICSVHGKIEAKWKEGVGKNSGKKYAFWSCEERMPNGDFCKGKVQVANTPTGKFDQQLDKVASQMDNQKKDEMITRTAIAKSLIEGGWKYNIETVKEATRWVNWVQGKALDIPVVQSDLTLNTDEIPLDSIPF